MKDKIRNYVNAYSEWYGLDNIKIVIKSAILEPLKSEPEYKGDKLFGCRVDVYDRIETDFYVTQILK